MEHQKENHPSLKELQSWMRWILTDPRGVSEALPAPRPSKSDIPADTFNLARYQSPNELDERVILDTAPLNRVQRLNIYAEGYFWRIVDVLKADYASVLAVIGCERFDRLVSNYLEVFPSRYTNISQVGCHLGEFLKLHPLRHEFPQVTSLAEFEWRILKSFFAKNAVSRVREQLANVPQSDWGALRFIFSPSVEFIESNWNVSAISQAVEDKIEITSDLLKEFPCRIMIYRPQREVKTKLLSCEAWSIFRSLYEGASLQDALSRVEEDPNLSAEKLSEAVTEIFQNWVADEILIEAHLPH